MLIFVDCEADGGVGHEHEGGQCPAVHRLTQIGAVTYPDRKKFYVDVRVTGMDRSFRLFAEWLSQVCRDRPCMVSDNPAYDFQWISDGFWRTLGYNPFGHSARRIADFYAGLTGDFHNTQKWKRLRITKHTHHPVDDAMGNLEAFERMLRGER